MMTRKFEIVKGQREYVIPISADTEYCVSGSGTFTVEILDGGKEVYALMLREDYVQLPKFSKACQMRLIGRDTMAFTIFVSDSRTIGE
jgi:hypothetical protein